MVDVDFSKLEDKFHESKMHLEHIISDKVGLLVADTKSFLNTKKVGKREKTLHYIRQNNKNEEAKNNKKEEAKKYQRDEEAEVEKAKHLIRMEKKMYEIVMVLEKININIREIKRTNYDMAVDTITQIRLARELMQKINGFGLFVTKITEIKEEERKEKRGAWEAECD